MCLQKFTWIISCVVVAIIGIAPTLTFADDTPSEDIWQVFRLSGQRIGYGRTTERTVEEDGRTLLITESVQKLTIRRFGQILEMEVEQTYTETEDGELVRFSYVMDNPPNSHLETTGVVDGNIVRITTTVLGVDDVTEVEEKGGVAVAVGSGSFAGGRPFGGWRITHCPSFHS